MHLTKPQLRKLLRQCSHVSINGWYWNVAFTAQPVTVESVVLRLARNGTDCSYSANTLLNATVCKDLTHLSVGSDQLEFFKLTPLKLKNDKES